MGLTASRTHIIIATRVESSKHIQLFNTLKYNIVQYSTIHYWSFSRNLVIRPDKELGIKQGNTKKSMNTYIISDTNLPESCSQYFCQGLL